MSVHRSPAKRCWSRSGTGYLQGDCIGENAEFRKDHLDLNLEFQIELLLALPTTKTKQTFLCDNAS